MDLRYILNYARTRPHGRGEKKGSVFYIYVDLWTTLLSVQGKTVHIKYASQKNFTYQFSCHHMKKKQTKPKQKINKKPKKAPANPQNTKHNTPKNQNKTKKQTNTRS